MSTLTSRGIVFYRLPRNTSPAFFLYSDWASGVIFLRTLYTHILNPQRAGAVRQPGIRIQRRVDILRDSIREVQQVGITNISLWFGLEKILFPLMRVAGFMLCFPYILTKGILPRIPGMTSQNLQIAYRNAWWVELISFATAFLVRMIFNRFSKYRAGLRDRLYLERRELMDLHTPEIIS